MNWPGIVSVLLAFGAWLFNLVVLWRQVDAAKAEAEGQRDRAEENARLLKQAQDERDEWRRMAYDLWDEKRRAAAKEVSPECEKVPTEPLTITGAANEILRLYREELEKHPESWREAARAPGLSESVIASLELVSLVADAWTRDTKQARMRELVEFLADKARKGEASTQCASDQ